MAKHINWRKPYGKVSPAYQGARYFQDGEYFDAQGRRVNLRNTNQTTTATKSAPKQTAPANKKPDKEPEQVVFSDDPATLADQEHGAGFFAWRAAAHSIFEANGIEARPASRDECEEILREIAQKQMQATGVQAEEPDDDDGETSNEPDAPAPATTDKLVDLGDVQVNLTAWARGTEQVVWADVRKAIRAEYARGVEAERDAIDLLIEEGAVSAAEARTVE